LSPVSITNTPVPSGTLRELLSKSNVVYFDREVSGPREEAWLYVSQLFRIILRRNQLPPECNTLSWLKASAPFFGNSSTTLTKTGAAELSLTRTSTTGLTALELQFLVDWLESPRFPYAFYSVVSKIPMPTRHGAPSGPQSSVR